MSELLADLVAQTALRAPDLPALVYRTRTLTYADLWQRVHDAAGGLAALGVERGDRVAVFLEKRFETVIALFGAAAAGAVFVPVNP